MQRERKMKLNKHYSELNESYLFSTIAHKVAAYQKANPDKDIIRLGHWRCNAAAGQKRDRRHAESR